MIQRKMELGNSQREWWIKLCRDFEHHLRKTTSGRRPDVTIEYKNKNNIFLMDMACPSEKNVEWNHAEK